MKYKNCKKGMYVLAKSKSIGVPFDKFLEYSPLSLGIITYKYSYEKYVTITPVPLMIFKYTWNFRPEDLIELDDKKNCWNI